MTSHPFRIREIALQASLSVATVDRVLNGRGGVRASTVQEVHQAVADLERQRSQVRLGSRTFLVDVVLDAPERFSAEVRASLEAELPSLWPAVVRARFHCLDSPRPEDLAVVLNRIIDRRSHGIVLKAPDIPEANSAVRRAVGASIPVVTLVTDLPASPRAAYVGIDNRAGGATAAYLLGRWLDPAGGDVLVVRSSASFRGEDEREMGFRATLRAGTPRRNQVDVIDDDGRDDTLTAKVTAALAEHPAVTGVYSMYSKGGSHNAVIDAFGGSGRVCAAYVAHDLNPETVTLLREGAVSAVLHHDLQHDMRRACGAIMRAHGALPGAVATQPSPIQVITPHNIPPALRSA